MLACNMCGTRCPRCQIKLTPEQIAAETVRTYNVNGHDVSAEEWERLTGEKARP